ncbi:MAG: hypothetical protein HOC20_01195 [Chloroflexi bacterium]|jgi:polyferredoxin|nr:hypothetical protein [Chloroflexota bacterium]
MSKQLFKQPNMFVFWLVLASGVAYVVTSQKDGGSVLSTIALTAFWCSAVAYFSIRVYQFAQRKNKEKQSDADLDTNMPDDG